MHGQESRHPDHTLRYDALVQLQLVGSRRAVRKLRSFVAASYWSDGSNRGEVVFVISPTARQISNTSFLTSTQI